MSVSRYLDCSTGHLSAAEADRLRTGDHDHPVVIDHEYGWWVWVPPTEDITVEDDRTFRAEFPTLAAILDRARRSGCRYVCLDADGDKLTGELPMYDR